MNLIKLLRSGRPDDNIFVAYRGIIVLMMLSGLGNAVLIALINDAAALAVAGVTLSLQRVGLYVLAFLFFFISNRGALIEANTIVQERLEYLRGRVIYKITRAPLLRLEQIGHGELFAAVGQEINYLSQNIPMFVSAVQSTFLLVFVLGYIALISLPSFVLLALFTAAGLWFFVKLRASMNDELRQIYGNEAAMLDAMAHFTKGFQEIRLNAARNDALFAHMTTVSNEVEQAVLKISRRWVEMLQFSNTFLYAMVGIVIFILPVFFEGYADTIYRVAAAAIFCVAPVMSITAATHMLAKAEIGLGHVYALEQALDDAVGMPGRNFDATTFEGWSRIGLKDAMFTHRSRIGEPLFTFGPANVQINRGTIVFVTGGNGSGKSTAMMLLCGLYPPDHGAVLVDDEEVSDETRQDYRELFSAVFPDFHLFNRLHGLGEIDSARAARLIERMELTDKVRIEGQRFSTRDLSTGQRKRLAMIASLLEDRDVYLFDEWAADQDAHFRGVFYDELLPELKRAGKTVIAVTHDDRYWDRCDQRIVLELGVVETAIYPGRD